MKEALLYKKLKDSKVACALCAHRCVIKDGERGKCGVRENRDGTLMSLVYGRLVSMHIDPIEKKPLFHFLPGTSSFSIATVGCNLRCMHCQNYEISEYPRKWPHAPIPGEERTAEEVVEAAARAGCESISYTYTEPTIFLEFALDTARIAKARGIKNIFVSNGFMSRESAELMAPFLDGNNIDLKGDDAFYRKICGARLKPVQDTIGRMKEAGVWVEVTTLVIPGLNDSPEVLSDIAAFIISVSPDIPWHVTQFYPTHEMRDRPRTPVEVLRRARDIGMKAGLKYVYEGNVPGEGGENTYCPVCGKLLIERVGYVIGTVKIEKGLCFSCGAPQPGVW